MEKYYLELDLLKEYMEYYVRWIAITIEGDKRFWREFKETGFIVYRLGITAPITFEEFKTLRD